MYTVSFNGQQFGPHSKEDILSMFNTGMIDGSATVFREGWPNWLPVSSIITSDSSPSKPEKMPIPPQLPVKPQYTKNEQEFIDRFGKWFPTGLVTAIVFGLVAVLLAEYSGIGGGLSVIAEPWSPIRDEVAKGYGVIGAAIGLALSWHWFQRPK